MAPLWRSRLDSQGGRVTSGQRGRSTPNNFAVATIGKKLSTLSGDQLGKMGYFCQDRFLRTISSKLGRCVLHGGVKTTVGEKGGSSRLVEELERFER